MDYSWLFDATIALEGVGDRKGKTQDTGRNCRKD